MWSSQITQLRFQLNWTLLKRENIVFFLVKLKSIKDTYLSTQQPPTEQPSLKYRHKKHK